MDVHGASLPPPEHSHANDRDSPRQDSDACVRDWTTLLAHIRFGVVRFGKRKSVSGGSIKAVAARCSTYADADGSRVFPGLARLTVDTELSYETVKMAMTVLVRTGLLRLVEAGTRRGKSDRYQLQIPEDLLDREDIEVWSPARHTLEIERVREATRGRRKPVDGDPDDRPKRDVQGAQPSALSEDSQPRAECSTTRTPVDNSNVQGAQPSAHDDDGTDRAGCSAPANPSVQGAEGGMCRVLSTPPPSKDLYTLTTHHEMADVEAAVTVSRDAPPLEDPFPRGGVEADRSDSEPPVDGHSPVVAQEPTKVPAPPSTAPAGPHARCAKHPPMRGGVRDDGLPHCAVCRRAARQRDERDAVVLAFPTSRSA